MTSRRRPVRDQRGVSLVLVLVTLVIFGLIVPVLGQFGSTNGVSGYVLKGNRFDRYAAEAGMQAAINWAQGQRQAGRQGTHCPDITTGNLNDNAGTNAQRSVTVKCAGFDAQRTSARRPPRCRSSRCMATQVRSGAMTSPASGSMRTDGAWWSSGVDRCGSPGGDRCDRRLRRRTRLLFRDVTASPLDCRLAPTDDGSTCHWPRRSCRSPSIDPIRIRVPWHVGSARVVDIASGTPLGRRAIFDGLGTVLRVLT